MNKNKTGTAIKEKIIYYGFGGGLGHITRFNAFCNTFGIKPFLLTAIPKEYEYKIQTFAQETLLFSSEQPNNKIALRNWVSNKINEIKPDKLIIDAFPGGILGELTDLPELNQVKEIEYIARILKIDIYQKRINGNLPIFSKIWEVEELDQNQKMFLVKLSKNQNIPIIPLKLAYPSSDADSSISLPSNCWLIIHSGNQEELQSLYDYAQDIALLENTSPNFAIVGQIQKPDFLPSNLPYYSVFPVTSLLEKASKVISGAGFNIMKQMSQHKEKHLILPFERALDDQFLRVKLAKNSGKI